MKAPRLEKLWNDLPEQERQEIEKRAQELIAREKERNKRRHWRRAQTNSAENQGTM